jgi:hypothetical protein
MEYNKRSRDGTQTHTGRIKTSSERSNQGTEIVTVHDRLWGLRPDGIEVRLSTETKGGVFFILEYKHLHDVTEQYLSRTRLKTQN